MEIFSTTEINRTRDIEKDMWFDIINNVDKIVLFQSANINIEELKNDLKNIKNKENK